MLRQEREKTKLVREGLKIHLLDKDRRHVFLVDSTDGGLHVGGTPTRWHLLLLYLNLGLQLPLHLQLAQDWVQNRTDSKDGDERVDQSVDQDDWSNLQVCGALERQSIRHGTSQAG